MVTLPCKHVACSQCLQTWATKADLVRNTPAHVLENRQFFYINYYIYYFEMSLQTFF